MRWRDYPLKIKGFHSDNGSKFISKDVAKLLEKLGAEFTKHRFRQCNDNALAESKSCSVIREHFGCSHIRQDWAAEINLFSCCQLITYDIYLALSKSCYSRRKLLLFINLFRKNTLQMLVTSEGESPHCQKLRLIHSSNLGGNANTQLNWSYRYNA